MKTIDSLFNFIAGKISNHDDRIEGLYFKSGDILQLNGFDSYVCSWSGTGLRVFIPTPKPIKAKTVTIGGEYNYRGNGTYGTVSFNDSTLTNKQFEITESGISVYLTWSALPSYATHNTVGVLQPRTRINATFGGGNTDE